MNDAAQGVVEDVPQDVAKDLGFGARAVRALLATPPPPPPCLCAVRAEMGAQLGSSVAFGSGCGQTLPGVPRKAHLYLFEKARETHGNHRTQPAASRNFERHTMSQEASIVHLQTKPTKRPPPISEFRSIALAARSRSSAVNFRLSAISDQRWSLNHLLMTAPSSR